ncbi:DUF5677 domain-containing protein [Virgibacillus necropolis]|uniref:DUF5677 domain-containing protein n=1 Tax=Virgibacillus necropolis TaxID=163877 RepID=UPI00384E3539
MGRKSREKKERKHTTIAQHKRKGKTLSSPFSQLENMKKLSWKDDRLPSFLWIGLIINLNDRLTGINNIHKICKYFYDKPEELRPEELAIESISNMSDKQIDEFYDFLFNELFLTEEIKPLLLFESFPKKHLLEKFISIDSDNIKNEFYKLYSSVANMLDQQSQLATDCRWARIFYLMANGKLQMGQFAEEIFYYPQKSDMKMVRPAIRSCENAMSVMSEPSHWVQQFWDEALNISPCWDLNVVTEEEPKLAALIVQNIDEIEIAIREHFYTSRSTSAIDAKHEASFAFALYCIDILKELTYSPIQNGITGRLGLRTIAECYITLAYLAKKNDEDLWLSYRVYGSGQAKLAFLKIDELAAQPQFVSLETLEMLANEDQWQEYSDINLGHWENSNLRKMSEFADVKDIYNSYYDWTSGFAHGQWSSLRNSEFTVCGNPLHRLHRIPSKNKELTTVTSDAVDLCNKIINTLISLYPTEKIALLKTG